MPLASLHCPTTYERREESSDSTESATSTTQDHSQPHSDEQVVLKRLDEVGFAVNLRKSFFMQDKLEYLGYLLTKTGIRPQPKKVEAVSRIMPPKTKRQLRRLVLSID